MTTLSQIYGKPTCTGIVLNPKKASKTTPQAWENKGNWLYNWQGATDEAEFRGERLPTIEELLKEINSISWNCIEKAKALNIPFAGYRGADDGEFDLEGVIAYLWSSSPSGGDGDGALCVYLHRDGVNADDNWGDRGRGFLVRSFLDTSDTSSLWLFDEVIAKLQDKKVANEVENKKIDETISIIRNLK